MGEVGSSTSPSADDSHKACDITPLVSLEASCNHHHLLLVRSHHITMTGGGVQPKSISLSFPSRHTLWSSSFNPSHPPSAQPSSSPASAKAHSSLNADRDPRLVEPRVPLSRTASGAAVPSPGGTCAVSSRSHGKTRRSQLPYLRVQALRRPVRVREPGYGWGRYAMFQFIRIRKEGKKSIDLKCCRDCFSTRCRPAPLC